MSATAQIKQMIEEGVAFALKNYGGSDAVKPDAPDAASAMTQLKRENTGLRTRVKELEDRVTALEKASKPAVTATAGAASAAGKAHNVK
jgi:cell division protein FtsB